MDINKSRVIEMLASRGDHATAEQADKSLPDVVDTDQDKDLLDRFGVDASGLIETVPDRRGTGE
jgi:hypothetical protein